MAIVETETTKRGPAPSKAEPTPADDERVLVGTTGDESRDGRTHLDLSPQDQFAVVALDAVAELAEHLPVVVDRSTEPAAGIPHVPELPGDGEERQRPSGGHRLTGGPPDGGVVGVRPVDPDDDRAVPVRPERLVQHRVGDRGHRRTGFC